MDASVTKLKASTEKGEGMSNHNDRDDDKTFDVNYLFSKRGYLATPFMIYVRSYNVISDQEFMEIFGLKNYQKRAISDSKLFDSHVIFTNDFEWTHIADDLGYTLWHSPRTSEVIAELGKSYDIFRNSIGDIDDSFEFEYYRNGKLARKFDYEHNVFKGTRSITAEVGSKIIAEPNTFEELHTAAEKMFPEITKALGIVRVTDPTQLRYYAKEKME